MDGAGGRAAWAGRGYALVQTKCSVVFIPGGSTDNQLTNMRT